MFSALFSALADSCRALNDRLGAASNDAFAQHYSALEQQDHSSTSADFNDHTSDSFGSSSSFD